MRRAVLLALLLGGCQFIPGTDASKIADARAAVSRELRDPDSAQYRDERIDRSLNPEIVCGEVNSRNGFGALDGFMPYAFEVKTKKAFIYPSAPSGKVQVSAALTFPQRCLPPALR